MIDLFLRQSMIVKGLLILFAFQTVVIFAFMLGRVITRTSGNLVPTTSAQVIDYLTEVQMTGTWRLTYYSYQTITRLSGLARVTFETFPNPYNSSRDILILEATIFDGDYGDNERLVFSYPVKLGYNNQIQLQSIDDWTFSFASIVRKKYSISSTKLTQNTNAKLSFNNFLPFSNLGNYRIKEIESLTKIGTIELDMGEFYPNLTADLRIDSKDPYMDQMKMFWVFSALLTVSLIGSYKLYEQAIQKSASFAQISLTSFLFMTTFIDNIFLHIDIYSFWGFTNVYFLLFILLLLLTYIFIIEFLIPLQICATKIPAMIENQFSFQRINACIRFLIRFFAIQFLIRLIQTTISHKWYLVLAPLSLFPQIVKNVKNPNPYIFNYHYLISFCAVKGLALIYFRMNPMAFLNLEPYYSYSIFGLLLWIAVLGILYMQAKTDSKFFYPVGYFKPENNGDTNNAAVNEPPLEEIPVELSNTNNQANDEPVDESRIQNDDLVCRICLDRLWPNNEQSILNVDNEKATGKGGRGKKRKRAARLITTTCKHTFHTICLNKWLEEHSDCPHCNSNIQQ